MKIGDRVGTPFGEGVVAAIDQRTTWEFGTPMKTAWLVVDVDGVNGRRWVLPVNAQKL